LSTLNKASASRRALDSGGDPVLHFQHAGSFRLGGTALAILLMTFLRETGTRRAPLAAGTSNI
jgi:hypothetical protein